MDRCSHLKAFRSLLSILTTREVMALMIRYGDQKTRKETALLMDIRDDSVGKLISSALRKIKAQTKTREWFNQFPQSFFDDVFEA